MQLVRPLAPDIGPALPAEQLFDAAYRARADAYRTPVELIGALALAVRVGVALLFAFTARGRRAVAAVVRRAGGRPGRGAALAVLTMVVVTDVVLSPLAFWLGYVHDGAFGLRTQGFGGWLRDWVVAHAPVWAGVAVLAGVGFWLATRLPRTWPAVGGLVAGGLGLVVAFAGPLVLEPLEFNLVPLAGGPVRTEVERVLTAAGIRTGDILVADASRRTTRQNAYVSGLGRTRRIVLYDTLVQERTPAEVGVVLGHEIGHRRNGDLWREGLLGVSGSVLTAYALWALLRWRTRTGRQDTVGDPAAAGIVFAVVLVLVVASLPLQQLVSRRAEAAADVAALQITDAPDTMSRMQIALTRSNLGRPSPSTWVRILWASHPSPVQRLTLAARWRELAP